MKPYRCFLVKLGTAALILLIAMTSLAQLEHPDWQSLPLTDVHSGEVFTLGDFEGYTVFVEGMATWCGHCLQQLRSVAIVRDQLSTEPYIFIALSVDTYATAEELLSYADREGFDWKFAVVSLELLRELATVFGQKITRPLSHFIIRTDGSTTDLAIGVKSAEDLYNLLEAARLDVE